jgi:hypothetical protein
MWEAWLSGSRIRLSGSRTGFPDRGLAFRIADWLSGSRTGFPDRGLAFRIADWLSGSRTGFLDRGLAFRIADSSFHINAYRPAAPPHE